MFMRMANPMIARARPNAMNGVRRFVRSDRYAMIRQRARAAITGGTVCSWVCTVE